MSSYNWTCPSCKNTTIEEVMDNVIVCSEVTEVEPDGYLSYGHCTTSDGNVKVYQCMQCGWDLPLVSHTPEELYEYLQTNNMLKED
jgi:predicted RNA-binding Zn-ribbon protein involved in translation (DUF1610 family)